MSRTERTPRPAPTTRARTLPPRRWLPLSPLLPLTSARAGTRRATALFALAASAGAVACADGGSPPRREGMAPSSVGAPAPTFAADSLAVGEAIAPRAELAKLAAAADAAPRPAVASRNVAPPPSGAAISSMIIRTAVASVEVDSLEVAIAAVQRIAATLGGWVGNTSMSGGAHDVRTATIELKIPAPRFDDAIAGLRPIGTVENVTSSAQDVGEEFVDLEARTANARRLEARLVTLLATRTGKLEDVLNVERELARVREEIERFEGRLRYLQARVATSTLTVTVHERLPLVVPDTPGEHVLAEAVREAWRNFVRFVAALIASLGTVVPVALLALGAALAWRRFRAPRHPGAPLPSGTE
ncbi:MAG TPA: DUF4349 domain-containing protein [Gemmatimonadaceae bacterium]|nr:DUF4349 domain-containing protein [Gemmatimonadaceae bacterium]